MVAIEGNWANLLGRVTAREGGNGWVAMANLLNFDEPDVNVRRTRDIAVHNRDVEKQPALNKALTSYQARYAALTKFQKAATA